MNDTLDEIAGTSRSSPVICSDNVSYNNIKSHILYSYIFELFN